MIYTQQTLTAELTALRAAYRASVASKAQSTGDPERERAFDAGLLEQRYRVANIQIDWAGLGSDEIGNTGEPPPAGRTADSLFASALSNVAASYSFAATGIVSEVPTDIVAQCLAGLHAFYGASAFDLTRLSMIVDGETVT